MDNNLDERFRKARAARSVQQGAESKNTQGTLPDSGASDSGLLSDYAEKWKKHIEGHNAEQTRLRWLDQLAQEINREFFSYHKQKEIYTSHLLSTYGKASVRYCYQAITKGSDVQTTAYSPERRYLHVFAGPEHSYAIDIEKEDDVEPAVYRVWPVNCVSPNYHFDYTRLQGITVKGKEVVMFSDRDKFMDWLQDRVLEGALEQRDMLPERAVKAGVAAALVIAFSLYAGSGKAEEVKSDVLSEHLTTRVLHAEL